jgi:hypothetical protein
VLTVTALVRQSPTASDLDWRSPCPRNGVRLFLFSTCGRSISLRRKPDSVITTKVQNTAVTQLKRGAIEDMFTFLWKFYTGSVLPNVRLVPITRD